MVSARMHYASGHPTAEKEDCPWCKDDWVSEGGMSLSTRGSHETNPFNTRRKTMPSEESTTGATNGGYSCGLCGQWIQHGLFHSCSYVPAQTLPPPWWASPPYLPMPIYHEHKLEIDEIMEAIKELQETQTKILDILESL